MLFEFSTTLSNVRLCREIPSARQTLGFVFVGGLREGKGGALLGLAFFSQPQEAGAGDRPEGARPKKRLKKGLFWAC